MTTSHTDTGIAFDRAGPTGGTVVVLLHAGVADRRMWDPQWASLTQSLDTVRLDLRGFGDSVERPRGALSASRDVVETLERLGISRCHLVGASYGAGTAVEVALDRPDLVASLLLSAPGGSLIADVTSDLRAFIDAERAALDRGDLDAAVEANLRWWVDGPGQDTARVPPALRSAVAVMQRHAFEVTADWDDVEEDAEPPAVERLTGLTVPTLVVQGGLDLDAILLAAQRVTARAAAARLVTWPDVAHLPSLERPADFAALLQEWVTAGS